MEEKSAPRNPTVSPPTTVAHGALRNALGVQEVPRLFSAKAIQAQLRVGQAGDSEELEADRIAERVASDVASPPAPPPQHALQTLGSQRALDTGTPDHEGSPLKPGFREQMERALGADLRSVRIHDDAAAQASSQEINAHAFTRGEEVFLGRDARALDPEASQHLLAHEVVHVIQQRKAGVLSNKVSEPGDAHEREANHASHQALMGHGVSVGSGGVAPAVQRQISGGSITKRTTVNTASRAEVKQAIFEYLQRAQAAQGGSTLHLNQAVRTALLSLSTVSTPGPDADPGKAMRSIAMENVLNTGATEPSDLAGRAAQVLPDPFDRSALERLQKMPVTDPQKSTIERVKDLAEKNLKQPDISTDQPPSPAKQQDEIIDKMRAARGLPQPKTIGPGSVDILGLGRILRDLPGTIKPKPPAPPTPSAPGADVEQAIGKIPNDSLMPREARGTPQAGEFVDAAQDVARDLAGKIESAQKKGQEAVDLRLPDAYNHVKDRPAMIDAVISLVKAVREASPNHGLAVKYVDVYFGNRLVTRSVGGASQ